MAKGRVRNVYSLAKDVSHTTSNKKEDEKKVSKVKKEIKEMRKLLNDLEIKCNGGKKKTKK